MCSFTLQSDFGTVFDADMHELDALVGTFCLKAAYQLRKDAKGVKSVHVCGAGGKGGGVERKQFSPDAYQVIGANTA